MYFAVNEVIDKINHPWIHCLSTLISPKIDFRIPWVRPTFVCISAVSHGLPLSPAMRDHIYGF